MMQAENLEQSSQYKENVTASIVYRFRIVMAVGGILFVVFNLLDYFVYRSHLLQFLVLRIFIAIVFFLSLGLSYLKPVKENIIWLNDLMFCMGGGVICLMIYLADGVKSDYYQGLNLVLLAMMTVNSFGVAHNLMTGLAILLLYWFSISAQGFVLTSPVLARLVSAYYFMGTTLFFVVLTSKLYGMQHFNEFKKTEEVKRSAKELDEAYRKLRETDRLKDEFFANVSHEIRTPLTLMLAPVESLLAGETGSLTEPQKSTLEIVHNNAVRLLLMVNSLLDFSKLEAGKTQINPEPLEIVGLTQSILGDFKSLLSQKGLELSFESDPSTAFVRLDRYLYERILFNLLSNAIKFNSPNGKILVSLKMANNRLQLVVRDTGIGIAPAEISNLFQKFRQLEGSSTRRFEGTGLGLALVKEFSTLLGGTVSVQSKPGEGSAFTVDCLAPACKTILSREPGKSRINRLERYGAAAESLSGVKRGEEQLLKILIAEDNMELARYLSSLLSKNYDVKIAKDGEEALEVIQQWSPNLVLSDVMMPKQDGLSLCRAVKADPALSATPVVLLTALTYRDALLQGWEAGADEYLFKPFHPTELMTRIRSLLSNAQLRKDAERKLMASAASLARAEEELAQLQLFAHVTTHDLQEPLRKIIIFVQQLKTVSGKSLDETGHAQLEKIGDAAQKLALMIQGLRELSQVNRDTPRRESVDLGEVMGEALKVLDDLVIETHARVDIGILPKVMANRFQMIQLFTNLMHNAIKFHKSGIRPEVLVHCKPLDTHWTEIRVEDNGIGFDEKYATQIFEPFEKLNQEKEFFGIGLGLTICQKIVLRWGGKMTIESRLGQGSAAIVRLPIS